MKCDVVRVSLNRDYKKYKSLLSLSSLTLLNLHLYYIVIVRNIVISLEKEFFKTLKRYFVD
jgi:hypothetical protein